MSEFDEWINQNGFNFRPELYDLYKSLYEAGQQSKQAKINELQKQVITQGQNFNDQAQKLKNAEYFNKELQDRIDGALSHLDLAYPESWGCCVEQAIGILKGNKDETII